MSIESPLKHMISYVVNRLRKYGITPTRMKRDEVGVWLADGIILQQTFEFKEEVSEDDQHLVTRRLDTSGWGTEWFNNTLTVSYDGYSFYEESFRHAQKLCNQSA